MALAKTNKKFSYFFSNEVGDYCKSLEDLNKLQCLRKFFSKYELIFIYTDFYPSRVNISTKDSLAFLDVLSAYMNELNVLNELENENKSLSK